MFFRTIIVGLEFLSHLQNLTCHFGRVSKMFPATDKEMLHHVMTAETIPNGHDGLQLK